MKIRSILAAGLALSALAGISTSQDLLGPWDKQTQTPAQAANNIDLFVSTTGNDNTNSGLTPNDPFRSITQALFFTDLLQNGGPTPSTVMVTVNVGPGVYDTANGETFPLTLNASGVSLEAWIDGTGGPLDRPLINCGGAARGILVDREGNAALPPSVIQGLSISSATDGITVDPSISSVPIDADRPVSVEIRQNIIQSVGRGIRLFTEDTFVSTYVVEDNDIGGPAPVSIGVSGGTGIEEVCGAGGTASTLYRSNRIHFFELGLSVLNNAGGEPEGEHCAPRIFSNVIQLCEIQVALNGCDSFLINNTIAFTVNYTGVPVPVALNVNGGSLEYHNNILWSPDYTGHPLFGTATPQDEGLTGVLFPNPPTTNLVLDTAPLLPPNFVVGNLLPLAVTGPLDLHLTAASANAIGQGTNDRTVDALNVGGPAARTIRSWEVPFANSANSMLVRTDVNLDNDLDSRIHDSGNPADGGVQQVDIGADEYKLSVDVGDGLPPVISGRVEPVDRAGMAPVTQDALGNVTRLPGTPVVYQADLFLQGPANGAFALQGCFGFFEQLPDPVLGVPTQNGPLYQDLLFDVLAFGSSAIDADPNLTVSLGSGGFDANGLFVDPNTGNPFVRVVFNFNDLTFIEGEVFVQMLIVDPVNARFALSNRLKLELNDSV